MVSCRTAGEPDLVGQENVGLLLAAQAAQAEANLQSSDRVVQLMEEKGPRTVSSTA